MYIFTINQLLLIVKLIAQSLYLSVNVTISHNVIVMAIVLKYSNKKHTLLKSTHRSTSSMSINILFIFQQQLSLTHWRYSYQQMIMLLKSLMVKCVWDWWLTVLVLSHSLFM